MNLSHSYHAVDGHERLGSERGKTLRRWLNDGEGMELTAERIAEKRGEYPAAQPLSTVEEEHREMLPETFASGDYGWRDAEWVVQWYYRRFLGAYPDSERRRVEETYGTNSFEDVRAAIAGAVGAEAMADKLESLTALEGIDVPVGSAFLQFIAPDRYIVVSGREWEVLRRTGEIGDDYPDPPTVPDYERYLETTRTLASRRDCDLWGLYRALWVLGTD